MRDHVLATHVALMESGALTSQGGVAEMSLDPHLRSIVGPDEVGAIVDGVVLGIDPSTQLATVRVGRGELHVQSKGFAVGSSLRVQLLARDVIVSTQLPQNLSVRNSLSGVVTRIQSDDAGSDLVFIDIGGPEIMARITKAATRELSLRAGMDAWALVKSVSLRGHAFIAALR